MVEGAPVAPETAPGAALPLPEGTLPAGWLRAVGRGIANRCPRCGGGRVLGRVLRVRPACEACGLPLHHHRADDLPPYLVIFLVGHLVGAAILTTQEQVENLPLWLEFAVWPLVTVVLAGLLMRPAKGGVVGLQYALGMHGFGAQRRRDEAALDGRAQEEAPGGGWDGGFGAGPLAAGRGPADPGGGAHRGQA